MTPGAREMKVRVLGEGGIGRRDLAMAPTVDGGYSCRLVAPHGAQWLHLAVCDGDLMRFRCELAVDGAEPVTLALHPQGQRWRVDAGNRRLLVLPASSADPPSPIPVPGGGDVAGSLQVVLVLDGTLRRFVRDSGGPWHAGALLGDASEWPSVADGLARLVRALAVADPSLRWAMLAFGDQQIPGVEAEGLKLEYRLAYPRPDDALRLHPFAEGGFGHALEGLGALPSPGGDFVDALADALAACRTLDWRPGRRLVIVAGDSPGYSIQYPIGAAGNACARCRDVDGEVLALHAMGVEIMTLYQPPPKQALEMMEVRARRLVENAGQQYRRLASIAQYALRLDAYDPEALAAVFLARDFPIARGSSLGLPDQAGH